MIKKYDLVSGMFTSETKIRVRYSETDQMGFVYHANFFAYFESARVESLPVRQAGIRQLGLTYADMEKNGVMMPVVEAHAKFLRPARYDDLLTIKVSLEELPEFSKIKFLHEVFNEKEELLVNGSVVLYFVNKETMKPTTMPGELLTKLKPYFS